MAGRFLCSIHTSDHSKQRRRRHIVYDDPTQGTQIGALSGADPTEGPAVGGDDPTQAHQVGAPPGEDPTEGPGVGESPDQDPTQGAHAGVVPFEDPTA
jgi:hypothetical protein